MKKNDPVSKRQLESFKQQLVVVLNDLNSPEELSAFLDTFLTESEFSTLAKRLQILAELSQGKSYEEIQKSLGVSSATVSSASQMQPLPIMKKVFDILAVETWAFDTAKKIRSLFRSSTKN